MFKKLILYFYFIFLVFSYLQKPTPVLASFMNSAGLTGTSQPTYVGNPAPNSAWLMFSQSVNSQQLNIESWSGFPLISVMNHSIALMMGYPDQQGRFPTNKGTMASINNMIGYLYQVKPISTSEYIANIGHTVGLGNSKAYAQFAGPGSQFLPGEIFNMWTHTRSIAYAFFVIVFVIVGFMIMFRFKINPQTTISIQESLPKIILSLILVTLSYAIVALMVDVAFYGNMLIEYVIKINGMIPGSNSPNNTGVIDLMVGNWGGQNIGNLSLNSFLSLLRFDPNGIILFITILILITSVLGIFFVLLTRYVTLVLYAIFSPIILLFSSMPGQDEELGKYFKTLFASAISFPAIYLFISLSNYFFSNAIKFTELSPFLFSFKDSTGRTIPIFAQGTISQLIGLGILMITPKIPDTIAQALKSEAGIAAGAQEMGGFLRRIPIIGSFLG